MATAHEQQMAGSLRRIDASLQSLNGARALRTIVDRTHGAQVVDHANAIGYKMLLLKVYDLGAKPGKPEAEPETKGEAKPKAEPKAVKAGISVTVNVVLPDGDLYPVASEATAKAGQLEIELPWAIGEFQLAITVDGEAEYAVFGF